MNDRGTWGIEPAALTALRELFARTPGIERVWLFGSRATGAHRPQSDIDIAIDAPGWTASAQSAFADALEGLGLVYRVDCAWWQDRLDERFRAQIEAHRVLLWAPAALSAPARAAGGIQFKDYQERVLDRLRDYLAELEAREQASRAAADALRQMPAGYGHLLREAEDFPRAAWQSLQERGLLPEVATRAGRAHSSRHDGAGRPIPNVCFKVPTGGGKTLLAAASIGQVFDRWFRRHTGLVLWVVPNEAIYRQTLKALNDRDHPYRQLLNLAGAGRVKVLEKHSPLSRQDVDGSLCVMVLMLASAARQTKETLRFFRDRGNVHGFVPREDDIEAHWRLLQAVPNLDVYAPPGMDAEAARRQKGSIVKTSLGNVMRMLRPMVVLDEGHHGYTANALATLDGFNPGFLLELSATPRVASTDPKKTVVGSNILVDVRGTDLDAAQMIKLPIHVDVRHWADWQSCLSAAKARLDELRAEAERLQGETARYIRPILLVQVERTGADMREAGYIHAEDAKAHLMQLGFAEAQIAIKTSEKDELQSPENADLLSPTCEVRVIITRHALREGWDCPFAYVLCALAASRNASAMTQLIGRILRQPQATKTGREALDGCYVLCHDAETGKVAELIRKSLEGEGMGDLLSAVVAGDGEPVAARSLPMKRRAGLENLRLFLPRVTCRADDGGRRELVYESDVLAGIDWADLDAAALADDWAPGAEASYGARFDVTLAILERGGLARAPERIAEGGRLDRAAVVRALLDIAPNPWLVWDWVGAAVAAVLARGVTEAALAASSATLIEHLRRALEAERDRRAERVFEREVSAGRIEFALRADACDYALPEAMTQALPADAHLLTNADGTEMRRSLLEPVYETGDLNGFEAAFAGYLDTRKAVRWWHRNVARTQYGLQGWKRHKVYPDFIFGLVASEAGERMLLVETKGVHLAGSEDTAYKQRLLARLTEAYRDERFRSAGELELVDAARHAVLRCELLVDQAWKGRVDALAGFAD